MIRFDNSGPVSNDDLNDLFAASWPGWSRRDFSPVFEKSLGHITAHDTNRLVGFINVATDGGVHAFLLDVTVHPDHRRRGIGSDLVRRAVAIAKSAGATWVHVDFEPRLTNFYHACGFSPTAAGLLRL